MKTLDDKKLIVFFTKGVSVETWAQSGLFQREVALYQSLRPNLSGISFITYGNRNDLKYKDQLAGIKILCNRFNFPLSIYTAAMPILFYREFLNSDFFKTNQTKGAVIALRMNKIFKKKLIVRCGFMWSLYWSLFASEKPDISKPVNEILEEKKAFTNADMVIVTTEAMKQAGKFNYSLSLEKIAVIPNYVLTDVLKPGSHKKNEKPVIIFVGRFELQKNLSNFFIAVTGLNVKILMVGDGPLRQELETRATQDDIDVDFLGRRPHNELPDLLNCSDIFVLPSYWEGHPKVLIEAMSCGLPVIGSDVAGIKDVIRHEDNGYLCGTSPSSIRTAIERLINNEQLRDRLGKSARKFAVENYSLDRIVQLELDLLKSLYDE